MRRSTASWRVSILLRNATTRIKREILELSENCHPWIAALAWRFLAYASRSDRAATQAAVARVDEIAAKFPASPEFAEFARLARDLPKH